MLSVAFTDKIYVVPSTRPLRFAFSPPLGSSTKSLPSSTVAPPQYLSDQVELWTATVITSAPVAEAPIAPVAPTVNVDGFYADLD